VTKTFTVAIIGAGPSGLMAAERLAEAGVKVTVYERMPTLGRKFLMAGRGGLNLTHSEKLDDFLTRYGAARAGLEAAIKAFPPEALKAWAEGLGQPTFTGSSGRIFPLALKASPLLRAWLKRLSGLGVEFRTRHDWTGWSDGGALQFRRPDLSLVEIKPDAILLALGGASWPRLGSNGAWVDILAARGVAVTPLRPANCGFTTPWTERFKNQFAGKPLKNITVTFAGRTVPGEAVITAYGMEGGVIYALSPALREAIDRDGQATVTIDLRPDLTLAELVKRLEKPKAGQSLSNILRKAAGLEPVAINLMRESTSLALPHGPAALASLIKALPLSFTGIQSLERAISTAGGVAMQAIDENFMALARPGVFVAGEMLDWEAPTGGYLLQGAFATGAAAAEGILNWLKPA
jgi:hypothetical protein